MNIKLTNGVKIITRTKDQYEANLNHFEKRGWAESTIVIRFWIIATVLALAGLATLKLR